MMLKEGRDYEIHTAWDEDDEGETEVKFRRYLLILPNCCDAYDEFRSYYDQKWSPVFLRYQNLYDIDENHPGQNDHVKPIWTTHGSTPVNFCPFCGEKLPDLKPREYKPKMIMNVTDGGYYCNECEERLSNCRCVPPEYHWEPA